MTITAAIGSPDRWARLLGRAVLAGAIAGIAGPFGSFSANIILRLIFWTGIFLVGTIVVWPILTVAIRWGRRHRVPPPIAGTIAILASCAPLAVLAAGGVHMFWPIHATGICASEWYWQTALVTLPMTAIAYRLEAGATTRAPSLSAQPEQLADLGQTEQSESLPPAKLIVLDQLIKSALCLQMEDHYLRVHGKRGSSLHHATLRSAVRSLDAAHGLQVHRSWWVARNAVRSVEETGRSMILLLHNGVRVPVARGRVAILRQQGWLEGGRQAG